MPKKMSPQEPVRRSIGQSSRAEKVTEYRKRVEDLYAVVEAWTKEWSSKASARRTPIAKIGTGYSIPTTLDVSGRYWSIRGATGKVLPALEAYNYTSGIGIRNRLTANSASPEPRASRWPRGPA